MFHRRFDNSKFCNLRTNITVSYLFLLALLMLALSGCDSGFSYRPDGWSERDKSTEWAKVEEGISFVTWGITGLTGSDGIIPEFEISNRTASPVVIESAALLAGTQVYNGELPGKGALLWRTILPGEIKRVAISWSFEGPAWKALG